MRVIAAAIAGRRPGSGAGARDRLDAAAGRSLPPALQLGGGGAAFGPRRQRAPRCLARGARRSGAHHHRNPLRGVHLPAASSRSSSSTRNTTPRTSSTKGFRYSARDLAVVRAQRARRARRSRLRDPVAGNPGECGHGALREASVAAAAGSGAGAAHGAGGPAQARRRSGIVDAGDAGHGAAPEGRRPGHRVLESPRLCAQLVLQCLRLGRSLRALRCAHDPAPPRRSSCAAITAARTAPSPRSAASCGQPLQSRRPGHRAGRGNLGATVPGGAAGPAGSRHGVRARRGANRARPRA